MSTKKFLNLLLDRQIWLWLITILSGVFLVVFALYETFYALHRGFNMSSYPTDGTFQLYDPLRRLAEGQVIGRDFPFFQGIGVPLFHWPVFRLLGENLFAVETAKWFVSPCLFLGSSAIFFYMYFKDVRKTIIATALFTRVAVTFMNGVVYPGNSYIGVRSTFPILVAAAMLWETDRTLRIFKRHVSHRDIAVVTLLGLSVICGTEQGLAAIVAFLLIKILVAYRHSRSKLHALIQVGGVGLAILLATLLLFTLFTLGHPWSAIRYAFIDIPTDQGWYFGAPPNTHLTWGNLLPGLFSTDLLRYYETFLFTAIFLLIASRFNIISALRKRVFLFMVSGGLVAFVVSAVGGYYWPSWELLPLLRASGLMGMALVVDTVLAKKNWARLTPKLVRSRYLAKTLVVCTLILIGVAMSFSIKTYAQSLQLIKPRQTLATARIARHADDYFASSAAWKKRINILMPHIPKRASLWSTYTSVYDSIHGSLNPSTGGDDYIIQALGKQGRESYEAQFIKDRPEYVITLNPKYFKYEEWLWTSDWGFYNQLFTHYQLIVQNTSHLLWRLNDKPAPAEGLWRQAARAGGKYYLPANNTGDIELYEVTVSYKASAAIPLPILDKMPRYDIDTNASSMKYDISLPPYETQWAFPVSSMPHESQIALYKEVDGLVPGKLDIKNVSYRDIVMPDINKHVFLNNYCSKSRYAHGATCSPANLKLSQPSNTN
jgi:hypothetical protein